MIPARQIAGLRQPQHVAGRETEHRRSLFGFSEGIVAKLAGRWRAEWIFEWPRSGRRRWKRWNGKRVFAIWCKRRQWRAKWVEGFNLRLRHQPSLDRRPAPPRY